MSEFNPLFAPTGVPKHVYAAAGVVADYFATENVKDWQLCGIGPVKGGLPMCDEYQPLDFKQWVASPDEWELQVLYGNEWATPDRFGPTLRPDGKGILNPDHWLMRRKPKQTVLYFYMGDEFPMDWWTEPNRAATHKVTFGTTTDTSSIEFVGKKPL
jgi:hypothetical protein